MIRDASIEAILRWRGVASITWLAVLLAWETVAPCFVWFRLRGERTRHALVNFALALLNVLTVAVIFVSGWQAVADWAATYHWGLLNRVHLPSWGHLIAAVLLLDAWTYAWHRANHRWPFLWRFHRVHHSDANMDVTTANRFHFGEIAMSAALRLLLIPILGVRFRDLVIYETLLQFVVQWHHANIALAPSWERRLRQWIVTPGFHKVHHSRCVEETDSNYSSLLPIWDRLFRSRRVRDDVGQIQIGINGMDGLARQSIGGLVRSPFRR